MAVNERAESRGVLIDCGISLKNPKAIPGFFTYTIFNKLGIISMESFRARKEEMRNFESMSRETIRMLTLKKPL